VQELRTFLGLAEAAGEAIGRLLAPCSWAAPAARLWEPEHDVRLALQERGSSVVLVQQPDHSWRLAEQLATTLQTGPQGFAEDVAAVKRVLSVEYGSEYPLVGLIDRGVGVHHAGLSDEVRLLLEWLTERGVLKCTVATTTLAQGMNFPVSKVAPR
jgi:replicative superfamily II helicase